MLFLLNDIVLDLAPRKLAPPVLAERFAPLSLQCVQDLGCELFSEDPLLHRNNLTRSERLAMLIVAKSPEINAALFVAPARGCPTAHVCVRYAALGPVLLATLSERQQEGAMNAVVADREVWRRMAA